jgi:hypothetical protein
VIELSRVTAIYHTEPGILIPGCFMRGADKTLAIEQQGYQGLLPQALSRSDEKLFAKRGLTQAV